MDKTESDKIPSFKQEELSAQKTAVVGRSIAMVAIAVLVSFNNIFGLVFEMDEVWF